MPFMYATSNVVLEARLTAARAAALDELLAANIPTDLANLSTAVGLVETEAAAAARDALVQTDLTNIEADTIAIGIATAGLAGAAMRGTDNALLAANYLGLQFTEYTYDGALADVTTYVPAAQTIVYTADIESTITAADDWGFISATTARYLIDSFLQGDSEEHRTVNGPMYCNGADGFRNQTGGQRTIHLRGLTMQ